MICKLYCLTRKLSVESSNLKLNIKLKQQKATKG